MTRRSITKKSRSIRTYRTTNRLRRSRRNRPCRGVVLVVVLLVVALLSLSAYTFSDLMLVEHAAAQTHADMAKTREAALSGTALVQAFLLQDPQTRNEAGGIYDNPNVFFAREVHADDGLAFRTLVSITSPAYDASGLPIGVRSGLEHESSRLNLNWVLALSADSREEDVDEGGFSQSESPQNGGQTGSEPSAGGGGGQGGGGQGGGGQGGGLSSASSADEVVDPLDTGDAGRDALMRLPGMTLEIADAILDWLDTDDEPRDYGAEVDYYSSLETPYRPRNGPISSIDELLMVRGVMPDLLYGRDQNRSGLVEESEATLSMVSEVDETAGSMDLGWASMLTTYSAEVPALNPSGEAKIELNGAEDVQTLVTELSGYVNQDLATFIGAYLAFGRFEGDDEDGQSIAGADIDFSDAEPRQEIESVVDLIDAKVEVDGTVYVSPLDSSALSTELDLLQDYATTQSAEDVALGRININEATFSVLMAIPGMNETVATTIVSQRDPTLDPTTSPRRHATWPLSEGLVDIATMRDMFPYITTGGDVYRAQVVGYFGDGSGVSRAEVILDATRADVPLLLWKDKTDLGRGLGSQDLTGATSEQEQ